jgi:GNAT superfamily N-acetyltransferase
MATEIRRLEHDELVNSLFPQYREFYAIQCREIYPNDNPESDKQILEHLREEDCQHFRFTAFDGNRIVGCFSSGKLKSNHPEYDKRKHVSWFNGFVLPEFRNQGIGRQLAKKTLELAHQNGVEIVKPYVYSKEGSRFLDNLGGKLISAQSERILELEKVDWSLIDGWLKIPVPNLKLEYHSQLSDELIERLTDISFASTQEVLEMDGAEMPPTLEGEKYSLKEFSDFMKNTGIGYHCLLLVDPDGNILGYTEGLILPENPDIFRQAMTTVWKHHRGKGYGKFLKASMLDHIRKNLPHIQKVNTGNNDLNDPMLAINIKLGFTPVLQWNGYRLVVADALKILEL